MKFFKSFLFILFLTSIAAFSTSYFLSDYLSKKIKHDTLELEYLAYNIQYLKDLHTLCMLDYTINPNGKEILKECKEIESKIISGLDRMEETSTYYRIYDKYFK